MFRRLFRARPSTRLPVRPGFVPGFEMLEDRAVPAVITPRFAMGVIEGGAAHVRVYGPGGEQLANINVADLAGATRPAIATADVTGDGVEDVILGSGAGMVNQVRVLDGNTFAVAFSGSPFGGFTGGVNVAAGDVTGDGTADLVLTPDIGGGGRVLVLRGGDFAQVASFFGITDPNFRGGARAAVTDVDHDGDQDIIVAAGFGGGPRVAIFDGGTILSGNPQKLINDFFAFSDALRTGAFVAAGDVNRDGFGDLIFGAGLGGGPQVLVISGQVLTGSGITAALAAPLASFFTGDPNSRSGVPVGAEDLNADGFVDVIAGGYLGTGGSLIAYSGSGLVSGALSTLFNLTAALPLGELLPGLTAPTVPPTTPPPPAAENALVTLHLNPLDINLLGLEIDTSPITVTVSAESGSGRLLGNALTVASNLVNLPAVSDALNNVLAGVVDLLNGASLSITEAIASGGLTSSPGVPAGTVTPVLDLFVAPVHLNLLGAVVDTSPIHLTIQARTGEGLVLGNVLTALANLFNPPLPDQLDLDFVNSRLVQLLADLNAMLPGIPAATSPVPPIPAGSDRVLQLVVPPIDLNLLGLNLQTSQIQVNADAHTGNGLLLGNVLTTLLNTLGATPENLTELSNNINALLAKVVGVLNAATLTLSSGAVGVLAPVLQQLTAADLTGAPAGSTVPVLDLVIASPDGSTPPVDVNLLGLQITTSNIDADLFATTGDGLILGNLVYNVAHLLDPDGNLNLLGLLQALTL